MSGGLGLVTLLALGGLILCAVAPLMRWGSAEQTREAEGRASHARLMRELRSHTGPTGPAGRP